MMTLPRDGGNSKRKNRTVCAAFKRPCAMKASEVEDLNEGWAQGLVVKNGKDELAGKFSGADVAGWRIQDE